MKSITFIKIRQAHCYLDAPPAPLVLSSPPAEPTPAPVGLEIDHEWNAWEGPSWWCHREQMPNEGGGDDV